jgi:TM2 domain-containing membrane protein YozV
MIEKFEMKRIISTCIFFFIFALISSGEVDAAERSLVFAKSSSKKILSPRGQRFLLYNLERKSLYPQPYGSEGYYASGEAKDIFQMPGEFEEKREGLKSVTKAALLSFILPGAGEIYGGSKTKGKIFIFSEASFWAGFFAFRTYGNWLKDNSRVYAASHAKVNLTGKTDDFFDQLSFYDSRDQYNQFALLYHRGEAHAYPEDDFWNWEWESRDSRLHYRDLKNRSKDASRRALYLVGLSIVNRIVSVVDAMKTVRAYNRKKSFEFSGIKFDIKADPLGNNPQCMFYLSCRW